MYPPENFKEIILYCFKSNLKLIVSTGESKSSVCPNIWPKNLIDIRKLYAAGIKTVDRKLSHKKKMIIP